MFNDPQRVIWRVRGGLLPGLLLALVCLGCARESEPRRANLLFISIDSLRADHLGCYGYGRQTSPHLDRLASQGVLFETMVADSSWTLPSHLTLLTGHSSWVHGAYESTRRLPENIDTLAEILWVQGYRTAGYASGPLLHSVFGFAAGFDEYELLGRTAYDIAGVTPEALEKNPNLGALVAAQDLQSRRARTSGMLAERVDVFLDDVGEAPFFLFVHMFDVHFDYDPPEQYWRRFNPDYHGAIVPQGFFDNPAIHADMPAEDLEQVIALYDGEISWTDEHLGRMLAALDRNGLAEDTLVVVVGDHGDEFFEHGRKGHRKTLFDEQLLVPFVMRHPTRLPADRRVAMQVRMIDVLPTLLDVLAIEEPRSLLGESLVPWVRGDRPESDLPALSYLSGAGSFLRVARTRDRKLFAYATAEQWERGEPGTEVLFDLSRDAGEKQAIGRGEAFERASAYLESAFAREDALRRRLRPVEGDQIELPRGMREELDALGYTEEAGP